MSRQGNGVSTWGQILLDKARRWGCRVRARQRMTMRSVRTMASVVCTHYEHDRPMTVPSVVHRLGHYIRVLLKKKYKNDPRELGRHT